MIETIEISMLPRNANKTELKKITAIVNEVYKKAEKSLWLDNVERTDVTEIAQFAEAGELAVVRRNENIIGCIRLRQIDDETGEFGLLAVASSYQRFGIGRQLIEFAERTATNNQLRQMQLELLVPETGTHPTKLMLEKWYRKLGYKPVSENRIEASFPKLAPLLAIPCKFVVFQKQLT